MRMLSLLSLVGLAGAAFTLASGHLAGAAAETPNPHRISGPQVHGNLAVYLVHGPSAEGPVPLTLAEALEKGAVRVHETGNVNTLEIENAGGEEVYIQSGDIVKGGQQDRVLTVSLVVPPRSGRVPIASYCVEQGRWAARGKEDVRQFASSYDALPSREAKLAMKAPAKASVEPGGAGRQPGRVPSYTGDNGGGDIRNTEQRIQRQMPGGRDDTGTRQGEVWREVARTQAKLAAGLSAASVAAPESKSSLQLSLENTKLKEARQAYMTALQGAADGTGASDVIGLVFAVDGRINSADVYPSNGLFRKMWPKLLAASITEAIAERPASGTESAAKPAPAPETIAAFLAAAEAGEGEVQAIGKLMKQEVRDVPGALYVEARRPSGGFVHRNYLAK